MPLQRNSFFGPAITATQIASVGYGNAQVIYFPVKRSSIISKNLNIHQDFNSIIGKTEPLNVSVKCCLTGYLFSTKQSLSNYPARSFEQITSGRSKIIWSCYGKNTYYQSWF
jgi:hypothetical protein